jgi:D-amino-acid dehydrogenase
MHVYVLGAGVIGVTTAYYLSERGHRVTVIDSADRVASGASGGNGGQLSYSFTDALAGPALLSKLPRILAGRDPAFQVRPPVNGQLFSWGLGFLRQCTAIQHRKNTVAATLLAIRSGKLLAELRAQTSLQFSFRQAGKLVLLNGQAPLKKAEEQCALKRRHGSDARVITVDQAVEIEPALSRINNQFAGAIYSPTDEVGDSLTFTKRLSDWLIENRQTEFLLDTKVRNVSINNNRLAAVETNRGTFKTDTAVVCLGAWSRQILHPLGIRTRIYPMRGYSVTLPAGEAPISVSVTNLAGKMVFSRLGEKIRIAGFADFIAGFADFIGHSTKKDRKRIKMLLTQARKFAPAIADYQATSTDEWGGFRPMTPDSLPLTGPCAIEGLHLNTGHGSLGWTMACVSGHKVANRVSGDG